MSHTYVISQIAVMAIITLALRVAPFLIFGGKKTPPVVQFLGTYLPYAIMGMLVVYCLTDVSVISAPHGLPELIAIVLVAVLHIWRRNTLLSIVSGTVCYMLLIQFCF